MLTTAWRSPSLRSPQCARASPQSCLSARRRRAAPTLARLSSILLVRPQEAGRANAMRLLRLLWTRSEESDAAVGAAMRAVAKAVAAHKGEGLRAERPDCVVLGTCAPRV